MHFFIIFIATVVLVTPPIFALGWGDLNGRPDIITKDDVVFQRIGAPQVQTYIFKEQLYEYLQDLYANAQFNKIEEFLENNCLNPNVRIGTRPAFRDIQWTLTLPEIALESLSGNEEIVNNGLVGHFNTLCAVAQKRNLPAPDFSTRNFLEKINKHSYPTLEKFLKEKIIPSTQQSTSLLNTTTSISRPSKLNSRSSSHVLIVHSLLSDADKYGI